MKLYCIDTDGEPLVDLCQYCAFQEGLDNKKQHWICKQDKAVKLMGNNTVYYCSHAVASDEVKEGYTDFTDKLDYLELVGIKEAGL